MTQNIYDTTSFFESYSKYPRMSKGGLASASEWPLLETMLPSSLASKTVLDLGCGDGWFSRWAVDRGAKAVCAMDVSSNMLSRARQLSSSSPQYRQGITFRQVDMDALDQKRLNMNGPGGLGLGLGAEEKEDEEEETYDLAFSGLALHYLVNLEAALRQVWRSLKPGGLLVFSVEHPIFTAPRRPGFITSSKKPEALELEAVHGRGQQDWPLSSYFAEGEREVDWLGAPVRKQHRTISRLVVLDSSHGFYTFHM